MFGGKLSAAAKCERSLLEYSFLGKSILFILAFCQRKLLHAADRGLKANVCVKGHFKGR
jgi:hypothetical protein